MTVLARERWSEAELDLLRDVSLSLREVAEQTGRSVGSVGNKASHLKVDRKSQGEHRGGRGSPKQRNGRPGWQEWELILLADPAVSLGRVAEQTGRTYTAVRHKASCLGLVDIRDYWLRSTVHPNSDWSDSELVILRDTSLLLCEVAERTGKSSSACGSKAFQLGIHRGPRAGAEHPKWVNGQYSDKYRGPDWLEVRAVVLERDGCICQDCGFFAPSGARLHVHHMIPWKLRQSNDLAWLVLLCESCHHRRPEHSWTEIPEEVSRMIRERR